MAEKYMLLVEDNADDEALTLHALRENNILNRVVVARDGAEALDYLFGDGRHEDHEAKDMPTVILLDLKLPKIDGLEVLRRLRCHATTRLLPVVILTTSQEDPDVIASYSLGANSYVHKSVDMNQFVMAVRQLGLFWLLVNDAPP